MILVPVSTVSFTGESSVPTPAVLEVSSSAIMPTSQLMQQKEDSGITVDNSIAQSPLSKMEVESPQSIITPVIPVPESAIEALIAPVSSPIPMQATERVSIATLPVPVPVPVAVLPVEIDTVGRETMPLSNVFVSPSVPATPQAPVFPPTPQTVLLIVPPAAVNIPIPETVEMQTPVMPVEVNIPVPSKTDSVPERQSVPFGSLPMQAPIKKEETHQEVPHDEWDSLLLSATDVALEIPTEVPSVPQKPVSLNREYHPIETSVDARLHHDDAPRFPY